MKFVVYGAGYRGKRLFQYLGDERIVAFIDSDDGKRTNDFCSKPVISLEQYKTSYASFPIIISPSNSSSIIDILDECAICNYSVLAELPSEFSGYGLFGFENCYEGLLKKYNQPCYLFGINAFSLLLFRGLQKLGNDVYFLQSENRMSSWVEENLSDYLCEYPLEKGNVFLCYHDDVRRISDMFAECNVIDAFDYTSNLPLYYNKGLEKLKNVFDGKTRCFIVATGPSIQKEDLIRLKKQGYFCFSVNRIYKMESEWKPDVYVVTDSVLLQEAQMEIAGYDVPLKFLGDGNICNMPKKQNSYVVHVVGGQYLSAPPPFSDNIAQKVYGGGTVTYACLQIAVYLGFQEIYLLGVDCEYIVGSKSNHFYEEDTPDTIERNDLQMILAFQAARDYAEKHGIKIYNATRGGKLEVFERVDFDSLF